MSINWSEDVQILLESLGNGVRAAVNIYDKDDAALSAFGAEAADAMNEYLRQEGLLPKKE